MYHQQEKELVSSIQCAKAQKTWQMSPKPKPQPVPPPNPPTANQNNGHHLSSQERIRFRLSHHDLLVEIHRLSIAATGIHGLGPENCPPTGDQCAMAFSTARGLSRIALDLLPETFACAFPRTPPPPPTQPPPCPPCGDFFPVGEYDCNHDIERNNNHSHNGENVDDDFMEYGVDSYFPSGDRLSVVTQGNTLKALEFAARLQDPKPPTGDSMVAQWRKTLFDRDPVRPPPCPPCGDAMNNAAYEHRLGMCRSDEDPKPPTGDYIGHVAMHNMLVF